VEAVKVRAGSVADSVFAPEKTESPRQLLKESAGLPPNLSTLTDISQYLSDQNNQLDSQTSSFKSALDSMSSSLELLQAQLGPGDQHNYVLASICALKVKTSEVWRQQIQSTSYLRQVTQALHTIAEQLAANEMEIDPAAFVRRETVLRSMRKLNVEQSHDMFYSFVDSGAQS